MNFKTILVKICNEHSPMIGAVMLSDSEIDDIIQDPGFNDVLIYNRRLPRVTRLTLRGASDDPKVKILLSRFESLGWVGYPRIVPFGAPSKSYGFTYVGQDEELSISGCRFFELRGLGTGDGNLEPFFSDDGLIAGVTSVSLDRIARSGDTAFGMIGLSHEFFCSSRMRDRLLGESMVGIDFRELAWDAPQKWEAKFYQMISTKKVSTAHLDVVEDHRRIKWFLDGANNPPILSFQKEVLDEISDWDFVSTDAFVGDGSQRFYKSRAYIISERFESLMRDWGVKSWVLPIRENHNA